MKLFFLDESGEAHGSTPILVVGGVIIPDTDWPDLKDALGKVKASFGIGPGVEVKWRHTRHHGGHKNPLGSLTPVQRLDFAHQVLTSIRRCTKARVIGVIIDVAKAR